ncbi:MAG: hypothetical protein ACR2MX_07095, partial [Cyclobacteriaceae bacterium]
MARIYKYWFALAIVLFGCQQKQAPEEAISEEARELQQIEKEVKIIHDQAMENIEPTMSLKSQLKESIELLKEDPAQVDEVILREMLIRNLDEAQHSMMDWMRSYNTSMAIEDPKERLLVMG